MKWWEVLIHLLGIGFSVYVYIRAYKNIFSNEKNKLNIKKICVILFVIVTMFFNTFYNYNFTKIIFSFLEIVLLYKFILNLSLKESCISALIFYFFMCLTEMIIGMTVAYLPYSSVQQFDSNIFLKVSFSILVMLIVLLMSKLKFIKKIAKKASSYMDKILTVTVFIILFLIVIAILAFYLIISKEIISFVIVSILIIIMCVSLFLVIFQTIKTKKIEEKEDALLEFIKKYEIIIDKERIDRHEMVNNLLVLKSIKNKNTQKYDKILDDILSTYKSSNHIRNLYNLPSGLKGLFYYKINDMQSENIETFVNISVDAIELLDNLEPKFVSKICKILGIVLDNAKEASSLAKEKLVIIDVYKEKDDIIIYIENTFNNKNKIDIESINRKGFSTKGTRRGYGLYLVKKILEKNRKIFLDQKIEKNKFISIIRIKK